MCGQSGSTFFGEKAKDLFNPYQEHAIHGMTENFPQVTVMVTDNTSFPFKLYIDLKIKINMNKKKVFLRAT